MPRRLEWTPRRMTSMGIQGSKVVKRTVCEIFFWLVVAFNFRKVFVAGVHLGRATNSSGLPTWGSQLI